MSWFVLLVASTERVLSVQAANGVTAEEPDGCSFIVTNFDKTSLSNVAISDNKLWVHVIAIYLMTILTLYVRALATIHATPSVAACGCLNAVLCMLLVTPVLGDSIVWYSA